MNLIKEARKLKNQKDSKILAWEINENELLLFVEEINEENKKLNGKQIANATIRVFINH